MIGTFDYRERISGMSHEWAEKGRQRSVARRLEEMERFWRQRAIVTYLPVYRQRPTREKLTRLPTGSGARPAYLFVVFGGATRCRSSGRLPLAPVLRDGEQRQPDRLSAAGGPCRMRYAVITWSKRRHRPPRGRVAGFPDPVRGILMGWGFLQSGWRKLMDMTGLHEDDAAPAICRSS